MVADGLLTGSYGEVPLRVDYEVTSARATCSLVIGSVARCRIARPLGLALAGEAIYGLILRRAPGS